MAIKFDLLPFKGSLNIYMVAPYICCKPKQITLLLILISNDSCYYSTMNKATTKHKIRFLNTCMNKTLFMWTFIQYKNIHSTHHSSLSVYIF